MKVRKLKKSNLAALEKERAKILFNEGYSISEIVDQITLSYETIQKILRDDGILKTPVKLTHKKREKLISKLFKNGKNAKEIGRELKIKTRVVTYILRKLNLVNRKLSYAGEVFASTDELDTFRKKLGEKVRHDYEIGKTITEIMSEYKISQTSIRHFLKITKPSIS